MKFRPLPFLTIFTIPILIVLFMLGNWQWHRYQFKLAKEAEPPSAPISLELALKNPKEFTKVHIIGTPQSRLTAVAATEYENYGKRYFGVVQTEGKNIMFEYGFVADKEMARGATLLNRKTDVDTIAVMRLSKKPNAFIPDNQPPEKFFWPDINAMVKVVGGKVDESQYYFTPIMMSPFGMSPRANPYADEKGATYVEPGRHLGYALTWWGLFISLIAVYVALHIKNGRLSLKK